jgi:hypothetical protein
MNTSSEGNAGWRSLYNLAAVTALLVVFMGVLDIALSMVGGPARENSTITAIEWFTLFQNNAFEAFRNLGLFNIINLLLAIPLYLALYGLHRRVNQAYALLAVVLFIMGTAIYISSNAVFSIFALSRQYAEAAETQRAILDVLGQAALAQGADLTPGTFMGFILTEISGILMAVVLLRGGLFSKATAWVGILGLSILAVFNIMAAFMPASYDVAMMLAIPGGLLSMAYYIMLARRLFQHGKEQG